jgi:hypothetical protein
VTTIRQMADRKKDFSSLFKEPNALTLLSKPPLTRGLAQKS